MMNRILIACLALFSLSSCLKSTSTNTCNINECDVVAPANEKTQVEAYLASNSITATSHCSGLYYVIDDMGTGKQPTPCSNIQATYSGKLANGATFDSGTFTTNLTSVIRGWTVGIPKIKSGGTIRLFIPPSLGYGSQSVGSIPANSMLIFTVKLDNVY